MSGVDAASLHRNIVLPVGHVLGITGVHKDHSKPMLLEDLISRDPINTGGFHRDAGDTALNLKFAPTHGPRFLMGFPTIPRPPINERPLPSVCDDSTGSFYRAQAGSNPGRFSMMSRSSLRMRTSRRSRSFSWARLRSSFDTASVSQCAVIHLFSVDMPTTRSSAICLRVSPLVSAIRHPVAFCHCDLIIGQSACAEQRT